VAAKKPVSTIPAAKLALYQKLIATDPNIERKGATIPYTSANGKMFTYLSPTGDLRLRLPPDEREAFMKKYKTISSTCRLDCLHELQSSRNTWRSAAALRSSSGGSARARGRGLLARNRSRTG
jgi:hypothetical protein